MSDEVAEKITYPRIMHEGNYRLYEKEDGTLHLVYLPNGADQEEHLEIPGALMQLAKQGAEGKMNPLQMMKAAAGMLMGGGGNPFGS
jgi:hypothetical protein